MFSGHVQADGPDLTLRCYQELQKAPGCPKGFPTAWTGETQQCVFDVPKSVARIRHRGQEDSERLRWSPEGGRIWWVGTSV